MYMLFIFGLIFLAFFISVFYFTEKIKDCECIDEYNKSKLLYIKTVSVLLFFIVTTNLYIRARTRKFSGGGADPTYVLTLIIYYIVILPIIIIIVIMMPHFNAVNITTVME